MNRTTATIYAVAARAGVSTATVSRALHNSAKVSPRTRELVMQAATDLNYLPRAAARTLAARNTNALGLVLPHVDGFYYAQLLVGFEVAASERGLSTVILLANPREDCRGAVRRLATQVDGIAFMARSAATEDLVSELSGARAVVTGARSQVEGVDALFVENRRPAQELTAHLIEHGRRRIAFVGRREAGSDIGERLKGWQRALTEAGLGPGQVIEVDPLESEGTKVAEGLLAQGMPVDALVCGNDELALAIMHRLQASGVRVPDEVAIVGWDDSPTARYIKPGLTTVNQPVVEMGRQAALRLADLLNDEPHKAAADTLPVTIVHRGSCGCAEPAA